MKKLLLGLALVVSVNTSGAMRPLGLDGENIIARWMGCSIRCPAKETVSCDGIERLAKLPTTDGWEANGRDEETGTIKPTVAHKLSGEKVKHQTSAQKKRKLAKLVGERSSKPVKAIRRDGTIEKFASQKEASEALEINRKTIWRAIKRTKVFDDDGTPIIDCRMCGRQIIGKLAAERLRKPLRVIFDNGKIEEFPSQEEASKALRTCPRTIRLLINGKGKLPKKNYRIELVRKK